MKKKSILIDMLELCLGIVAIILSHNYNKWYYMLIGLALSVFIIVAEIIRKKRNKSNTVNKSSTILESIIYCLNILLIVNFFYIIMGFILGGVTFFALFWAFQHPG